MAQQTRSFPAALDRPVFLDYQATTPLDPRVLDAMLPWLTQRACNPHSADHSYGWEAERALSLARRQVGNLVGAQPDQVVFVSGATEANNLAIFGLLDRPGPPNGHIITSATEHASVLAPVRALAARGFPVTELPVDRMGLVSPQQVNAALRSDTRLVTIMAVNNEIGVVQPLAEIGALCRRHDIVFHTDAAQAAGKLALDVEQMQIDMMSLSAHKLYGPMGIGALFVRRGNVDLAPRILGGAQESGLRGGTVPAPACVGFGAACDLAATEMHAESERLLVLRARLLDGLRARIPGLRLNGHPVRRIAGNLNLTVESVDAAALLDAAAGIAISTGAACASGRHEPSHVLRALGLSDTEISASIRIGLGRFTGAPDIDVAIRALGTAAEELRQQND